jgi:hypothetical protein
MGGSSASATSFVSRAPSVATVNAQGVITGVGEGQTWVAATAPGFAPDSLYVIVPRNATGPVLRTDMTNYGVAAGSTMSVNIVLDTRTMPIGGAEFSVGFTTSPTIFQSASITPMGSPAPVVSNVQAGVVRVSVASGSPLKGQLIILRFDFTASAISGTDVIANRTGFFILNVLDIVDPTGADLLPVSTSTRYPIIIQ